MMFLLISGARIIEKELKLLQTNQLLNQIINDTDEGIILTVENTIIEYNRKAVRLLGKDAIHKGSSITQCLQINSPLSKEGSLHAVPCIIQTSAGRRSVILSCHLLAGSDDIYIFRFNDRNAVLARTLDTVGMQSTYTIDSLRGSSIAMKHLKEMAMLAAGSSSNVLIQGETGTEKRILAEAIHHASPRKNGPFIIIHCSSTAGHTMREELFGNESGTRSGRLELANGGTLYLDEVDHLSMDGQIALSEYLQNHDLNRTGQDPIHTNVRMIASSSVDLMSTVKNHQFREDLYYQLNILHLTLPPLRERGKDIEELTGLYLSHYNRIMHKNICQIDRAVLRAFSSYSWPGNVRELESVMERAVNVCDSSVLRLSCIDEKVISHPKAADTQGVNSEYDSIRELLRQTHGNVKAVANEMHIPLSTMYRKLTKYNLDPKDYREW